MDSNGLADPYVKLHLLPGASKVKSFNFMLDVADQLHLKAKQKNDHEMRRT